ncbi:hypothetical protein EVAR_70477_1 [Eumeta japonica]|uniref:Uncharacterized protein n=1 Tax=Eumeta variegata TaxID=151549 RepID=A0A4C1SCM2_EUMVA|nr:hypothetical protein EVAR_70477_1 [Eumeta japonica]
MNSAEPILTRVEPRHSPVEEEEGSGDVEPASSHCIIRTRFREAEFQRAPSAASRRKTELTPCHPVIAGKLRDERPRGAREFNENAAQLVIDTHRERARLAADGGAARSNLMNLLNFDFKPGPATDLGPDGIPDRNPPSSPSHSLYWLTVTWAQGSMQLQPNGEHDVDPVKARTWPSFSSLFRNPWRIGRDDSLQRRSIRHHIHQDCDTPILRFGVLEVGAHYGTSFRDKNKCTLYKVCIRPVMTYAAPVFAHANPKALYQLQDMSKSSSTQLLTIPTHYYKQPYPTSLLHIISSEGHGMSFQTHRTNSPLRSKANKHKQRHDRTLGTDTSPTLRP